MFGLPDDTVLRFAAICQHALGAAAEAPALDATAIGAVEQGAERKTAGRPGGRIRSVMSPGEITGLYSVCEALLGMRPPQTWAYIMLGNSVAPVIGCLTTYFADRQPTVIPLPMSELEESAFTSWKDPTERGRMVNHIRRFVTVQRLNGRRPVIIDISGSGRAPRIGEWLLRQFFAEIGSPQDVDVQLLNANDMDIGVMGPMGPTHLTGLTGQGSSPGAQAAIQEEILQKVLKDEMLFRMWQRTPMASIFRGDSPPPDLLHGEFQRMMIDILKMPHVLEQVRNL
jgi:hypothetical protein